MSGYLLADSKCWWRRLDVLIYLNDEYFFLMDIFYDIFAPKFFSSSFLILLVKFSLSRKYKFTAERSLIIKLLSILLITNFLFIRLINIDISFYFHRIIIFNNRNLTFIILKKYNNKHINWCYRQCNDNSYINDWKWISRLTR